MVTRLLRSSEQQIFHVWDEVYQVDSGEVVFNSTLLIIFLYRGRANFLHSHVITHHYRHNLPLCETNGKEDAEVIRQVGVST